MDGAIVCGSVLVFFGLLRVASSIDSLAKFVADPDAAGFSSWGGTTVEDALQSIAMSFDEMRKGLSPTKYEIWAEDPLRYDDGPAFFEQNEPARRYLEEICEALDRISCDLSELRSAMEGDKAM